MPSAEDVPTNLATRRRASHHRSVLLADAQRLEHQHPAGGMPAAVPHLPRDHRRRRAVRAKLPGHQSQQPHPPLVDHERPTVCESSRTPVPAKRAYQGKNLAGFRNDCG